MVIMNLVYGVNWWWGWWWQPWANTIAYYPLETDTNDYSWNGYNLTPSNITYTTLSSWLKVATFNGSNSKAQTFSFYSAWWDFTVSMWIYGDWLTWTLREFWCNSTSDTSWRQFDVYLAAPNMIRCNSATTWTNFYSNNTWYHIVVTCISNVWKLYINTSLITTVSLSYAWNTNMALWYRIHWNDRWWKWYISKFILENKWWSEEEINNYYAQTYWYYL
jgi:hypothetical protein